jgi:Holliday junction resolvase
MSRGIKRERAVRVWLQERGWWVGRVAGSLGEADLIALKKGRRPRLVEVKSTAGGPYEHFQPEQRDRLRLAATMAGADALLAYWPPRGQLRWIPQRDWPR